MFMPRHVHLGGVPIAVPGDEDVLAIGLDVEGVGCLGNICCLSLRRRPSSLPRVPSITIRRKSVHDKVEQFFLPLTLENRPPETPIRQPLPLHRRPLPLPQRPLELYAPGFTNALLAAVL